MATWRNILELRGRKMTPRSFPVLSFTLVFVAPTTPHHDPQGAGGFSLARQVPRTKFTSPTALGPELRSQAQNLAVQVVSSKFLHTQALHVPNQAPRRPTVSRGPVPQDFMLETLPPKSLKSQLCVPTFTHIYTSPGARGLESLGSALPVSL